MKIPAGVVSSNQRLCYCNILTAVVYSCIALFIGSTFITVDVKEKITTWLPGDSSQKFLFNFKNSTSSLNSSNSTLCPSQSRPSEIEALPRGIVSQTSDLERKTLWGPIDRKGNENSKNLLAISAGIKQKAVVNQMVKKFPFSNFTVILFHYDGIVDEWNDLEWSDKILHISAIQQTKWWFAKRFLHPDIVTEYKYIFLWDEDIGVENFDPGRYLEIVEREGLEISQPGLDSKKSNVHYRFTERQLKGDAHKRIYNLSRGVRCNEKSTGFPCAGFVEMMAPVFSRAAWRCTWHMIQNDLVHAWGLDMKFGYCALGDPTKKVGVVDKEYIVHKGIPTLGGSTTKKGSNVSSSSNRAAVVRRCYDELAAFNKRWQNATTEDKNWSDPHNQT
ncbi:hypothetical protein Cni_G24924 [Canna indica]|uniref:Lysine ketoglutarate reductase trans-splicing related 1 n=1 Tax=Canna indica TaxID=4628 RepID=A0AAQ3L3F3_9LILI|nr:hypothetical protein Cni_G24924 [Canna indica]